jgi:signal transduction histidine kinase
MTMLNRPRLRLLLTDHQEVGRRLRQRLEEEEVDVFQIGDRAAALRFAHNGDMNLAVIETPDNEEELIRLVRELRAQSEMPPVLICCSSAGRSSHTEQEIRQTRKMETLGRLAAGIVHDFNNLLTVMISCNELLMLDTPTNDPRCGLLREMARAADRASALTRKLLAFSRKQNHEPEVVDLNLIVKEMEPTLRRLLPASVRLEIHQHRGPCRIWADPIQLEQLLLNLVLNARDAMPDGGQIIVATDIRECSNHAAASETVLRVADSGIGMDSQTQARLFEPFFTTKGRERGSGLGLSTDKHVVEQSGGAIHVESAPGKGATFSVTFPTHVGTIPVSTAEFKPSPLAPGEETILLVEDDPAIRALWRQTLQDLGYTVLTANDGASAVALAQGRANRVQLFVIDADLPRKNGWEVAREIAKLEPDLPIVLVSGHGEHALSSLAGVPRELPVLRKPFPPSTLARKVRELLDHALKAHVQPTGEGI